MSKPPRIIDLPGNRSGPERRRDAGRRERPTDAVPDAGPAVSVYGDTLLIRNLEVSGAAAAAAAHCVDEGRDAEDVVRQMLDIGGTVLQHGANSGLIEAVVREIRREGETRQAVRRIAEQSSSKGLRYEEQVRPVLEDVFGVHGDIVEDTSTAPGLDGRDKKGDFTVVLNPETLGGRDRRLVIEAKDRPTQRLRGKDGALTYLTDAMRNRQAEAGVFVCATPVPALGRQRLRVYPANRILVLFGKDDGDSLALEVACQLARAMAASALGDEDAGVDRRILTEKVRKLTEIIEQAAEIRGGLLAANRGLNRIDIAYNSLRTDALGVLAELDERLSH